MFRTMIRFSFVLVLGALFCVAARGQGTYTAASCNESDVNAVINGPIHTAVNGDTIIIPTTGSPCTWTSGITINGVGIDITGTGTPNTGGGTVGAGASNTVLIDNASAPFFLFTNLTAGETAKVELLTMSASGAATDSIVGPIAFMGVCSASTCPQIRVDNIDFTAGTWEAPMGGGFVVMDDVFGVVDHDTANEADTSSPPLVQVNYTGWLGNVGDYGDNSFASPDTFGTAQTIYIENNSLTGVRGSENDVTSYGGRGGARYACRFNVVYNMSSTGLCSAHGTDWNGAMRGQRQVEAYYNTVYCNWSVSSCNDLDGLNSGTGYYFSNTIYTTNGGLNAFVGLAVNRAKTSYSPWGECNGTSPYDQTPWSTTSQCLDQTGTGSGLLLEGVTPVLASEPSTSCTTAGQCWPQNALDPVYEAGETCIPQSSGYTCSPESVSVSNGASRVTANHYYYGEVSQSAQTSPTSPFNGTSGTGFGTLVNRPTTCTPHVGYWATDQGTWNTYNHNQEGELYICMATNAWTLAYTPYTYPHPLESSDPPVPSPPIDLTASAH